MRINSGEVAVAQQKRLLCRNAGRAQLPQRVVPSSSAPAVHPPGTAALGDEAPACNASFSWREVNSQSQQASQLPAKSCCSRGIAFSCAPDEGSHCWRLQTLSPPRGTVQVLSQ